MNRRDFIKASATIPVLPLIAQIEATKSFNVISEYFELPKFIGTKIIDVANNALGTKVIRWSPNIIWPTVAVEREVFNGIVHTQEQMVPTLDPTPNSISTFWFHSRDGKTVYGQVIYGYYLAQGVQDQT